LISTTSSSLESSSAIVIFVKPVSCGASSSSSDSMATAVNAAGSLAKSAFLPSTCVSYRVAAMAYEGRIGRRATHLLELVAGLLE